MSDLLRLARELDKEAVEWLTQSDYCRTDKCYRRAHSWRGRSDGLRQAAEMARHMHNQGSMRRDVHAGDVSGG